jgi:hypothetical protein
LIGSCQPKAIRQRAIRRCTQRAILFYSLSIVRASREGLISSIWTRHPPTSCTIRCIPTSTGSSSTPSTTTMRSRWTPRSTLGPPAPGRQHGLRKVRVVNARPTFSTTHSADGTDDVAAQWLCARRARSVRRRGGGAGCDDARLVAGGTCGLLLPSPGARVWFPPKVVASGKASKLSAFHLVQ